MRHVSQISRQVCIKLREDRTQSLYVATTMNESRVPHGRKHPICRPVLSFYVLFNPIPSRGRPETAPTNPRHNGQLPPPPLPLHLFHPRNRCARYGHPVERVEVARERASLLGHPSGTLITFAPATLTLQSLRLSLYTDFPINSRIVIHCVFFFRQYVVKMFPDEPSNKSM